MCSFLRPETANSQIAIKMNYYQLYEREIANRRAQLQQRRAERAAATARKSYKAIASEVFGVTVKGDETVSETHSDSDEWDFDL